MQLNPPNRHLCLLFLLAVAGVLFLPDANAASCKTESQMTAIQRNAVSSAARNLASQVQSGDLQALQANTLPVVAADFSGIAASANALKPMVQHATITVNALYLLDASKEPAGAAQTNFYCGTPLIVLNFTNLPPGKYALALLHATGVSKPQHISLILSETGENHWMLAGFFTRPMTELGHDGLWYWTRAREYAKKNMNWSAWFYDQIAASLLDPVQFLSSPNMAKLQHEAERVRPANLPGSKPMMLNASGSSFQITSIDVTTEFGGLDLEVHYVPDAVQLVQLKDPVAARKQAVNIMGGLLAIHPGLRESFRGIWLRADQGNASVYALNLPMSTISPGTQPLARPQSASTQPTVPPVAYDPTKPETQPSLDVDRDPVLSPDAADNLPAGTTVVTANGQPGEIQKNKGGMYTLREDVNEVALNCTVVDGKGQLVRGLEQGDFQVWEDDVPQTINSFQFRDVPVSMGILVDNSGSMRGKRAAVNAAALDLVRASNPKDAAFIVNFSDKAYLDQDFTSNINALEHGLSHYDSKSMTALYDAVAASATEMAQHAKHAKQVLLIVTDGADNASRLTLEQAVHRVQRLGGPVVYSIGLLYGDNKAEAKRARQDLETLSRDTGGLAYFPDSLQDVNGIIAEVAQDIRHQYSIGYRSTKPASLGGYRTVRVEAKARGYKKLIVRTRKGYYRQPPAPVQPHPQTAQTTAPIP